MLVKPETKDVIGLFGTCNGIRWRDPFMARYQSEGIPYYNPMVADWDENFVSLEAYHLANDAILLFPILDQSYSVGALSEIGFGFLRETKHDLYRSSVILIHPQVTQELQDKDPAMAKASKRARALVLDHVKSVNSDNILIVPTLDDMLDVSLKLHRVHTILTEVSPIRSQKS
jgi:hypothetical protein